MSSRSASRDKTRRRRRKHKRETVPTEGRSTNRHRHHTPSSSHPRPSSSSSPPHSSSSSSSSSPSPSPISHTLNPNNISTVPSHKRGKPAMRVDNKDSKATGQTRLIGKLRAERLEREKKEELRMYRLTAQTNHNYMNCHAEQWHVRRRRM
eukprot:GHVQ01010480.1.p1 GENE.GHVQ01010480.1~~GHVQ01010480.1.p1  ORF type:complete len:151 (+),score=54.36 GHVQ01010480.1:367-819(+)